MSTNNYGEPWKFNLNMDAVPITRADGEAVLGNCEINEPDLVRAVTCVNACADIPDPAAAIEAAREALEAEEKWRNERDDCGLLRAIAADKRKKALNLLTPSKP